MSFVAAHLSELAARRTALRLNAAFERDELDALLARTDAASRWIGQAGDAVREISQRPLLVAAIAVAVFAARPRRLLQMAASAWGAWRLYTRVRDLLK